MRDAKCPYCNSDVEICHDDGYGYSEHEIFQQECWSCGKTFIYTTNISFSYYTDKADCLNDGKHDYDVSRTIPRRYSRLICKMCGDEMPLPANHPFLTQE